MTVIEIVNCSIEGQVAMGTEIYGALILVSFKGVASRNLAKFNHCKLATKSSET